MIIADISQGNAYPTNYKLYQYDYGRILRIQGMNLPAAVEIDFGLSEKGGDSIKRIGTTVDGVTDVPIPDSMLENNDATENYYLYAFIYLDDGTTGQTVRKITLKVTARPKPEAVDGTGETTLENIMSAVNQIADEKADTLDYKNSVLKLLSGETELSRVIIRGGSGGGADAREIELRKSATAIQWRYTGDETWNDLVTLAEITGAQGEQGIPGPKGEPGAPGQDGANGKDGITPHIGDNGNWYTGDTDTGVKAEAPSIDSTLTESGKAADAAETGKKIGELKEDLEGKEASGTAESKVSDHNTATDAHNDIRLLIGGLTSRLNALADSDDIALDQMSEVVAYIKSNKSLIDAITTNKVSVADIIDNLTTNVANKPLSAAQGVALKAMINAITVPSKLPNPNALTFTGAVEGSYDGSEAVSVEIPSGGGSGDVNHALAVEVLASGTVTANSTDAVNTGVTLSILKQYKLFLISVAGASNIVLKTGIRESGKLVLAV